MPLIPQVGRKSLKSRLLIAALYLVLSVGSITMVYPFALMLATSMTSSVDQNDYELIPRYLRDDKAVYTKYAEDKYAGDVEEVNRRNGLDFAKIDEVKPTNLEVADPQPLVEVWLKLLDDLPLDYWQAGFRGFSNGPSLLNERYQRAKERQFKGNVAALNEAYLEENASFQTVFPPLERLMSREWFHGGDTKMKDWLKFKADLPREYRLPTRADALFQDYVRGVYRADLPTFNQTWKTNYETLSQIRAPLDAPDDPAARRDYEQFLRTRMPFRHLRLSPEARNEWADFLRRRHNGNLEEVRQMHKAAYATFADIPLPTDLTQGGILADYSDFIRAVPARYLSIDTVESRYADALRQRFGTVQAMNEQVGANFTDFSEVRPPEAKTDWQHVQANVSSLRRDFATRNYRLVINYILLHGSAVVNTVVYCSLAVLTALIVNPLCAYALSRYPMRSTYRILLIILATMAFPAEVTMIPNFLLLKDLDLLNTYWALVLPAMAGPFMIFLLKGFFDSLPKELFEAGLIDGATELVMFWKVTIPLSKPIFAVIALQAFTAAYGAFMFAFLVCQDQSKWTMMVWLYQLQLNAPKFVTMAALTVAALPTLLIFIFAQNIIMRGIIIPTSK